VNQTSKTNLHVLFMGESYLGGMAGSKRIQNIINSLLKIDGTSISNLITIPGKLEDVSGKKNTVHYKIIYYSIKNILQFISHYRKGFAFIKQSKQASAKNILYCYDSPTILILPFLIYAKRKKYKVIVDFVEDYNLLNKNTLNFKQRIKLKAYHLLENNLSLYANGILAISSYLQNNFQQKAKGKLPIMYLPITVNFDLFKTTIDHKKEKDQFSIFYGGSFGEKDGPMFLMEAFDKLADTTSNITLILTGKSPKSGMNEVLEHLKVSRHKSKIHFLGYLNDDEYYKTLQDCDIFCMTRVNSSYANAGFPFKLGEMLATGKPVLATTVGDVGTYLKDKKNAVLIAPNSVDEIVNGLTYIINHSEEAAVIGENGKKTASEFFDSDKISINLHHFLLNLK
jgi:glycosyltransferase involved in cell wall biosynthesis